MAEATHTHTQTTTPVASRISAPAIQKQEAPSACCGPAPTGTDACCVRDAEVKATGGAGCGCGSVAPAPAAPKRNGCCG